MRRVSKIGFVVRLLYFLVAPFMVVAIAAVIPMTGVLINFVLLLASFIGIEALRRSAQRYRIVERVARRQLRFEAFYREHPPRMFPYYAFYPLLFPYWLANRIARQEFGLYRGFTVLGVILLVVFGAVDYQLNWTPELPVREFLKAWFATFILQIVVMIAFLIPLSVTIVSYQLAGRVRNVRIMLGTAALSIAFAFLGMLKNGDSIVPAPVVARVRLRSEAAPERAVAAQTAALTSVWQDIRDKRFELDHDGWLTVPALGRARAELTAFYRPAEANAFQVRVWPVDQPTHVLLQCHQPSDRPPVWLAMHADGSTSHDPATIPAGYLDARPNHKSSASH